MPSKTSRTRLVVIAAIVALAVVGGFVLWTTLHKAAPVHYVTAAADIGDVAPSTTASGTVNPVVTVQVGSYVSGTIQKLACDYNTRVRKGQLCASIDSRPYAIVVDQDAALLATAQAQLAKDQANLTYARLSQQRAQTLNQRGFLSRDAADSASNVLGQAQAQIGLDQAVIRQRSAELKAARINLAYTDIVSPVDGTVVSRNVNVGQTVAASFQTPTLFLIATDLTRMQVDTNVSESDIAGVTEGAHASFTVEAFPGRTFEGTVSQVRQAPVSVQNVITYDAVITVSNPDLALKPGMTATVQIDKARRTGVLRAPSQALRFTPAGEARTRGRHVWVLDASGKPRAVQVKVGLDDDSFAEIRSGALSAGDRVIVSETAVAGRSGRRGPASTASAPRMRF